MWLVFNVQFVALDQHAHFHPKSFFDSGRAHIHHMMSSIHGRFPQSTHHTTKSQTVHLTILITIELTYLLGTLRFDYTDFFPCEVIAF